MDALVALALMLVGFALGSSLVFFAQRRAHAAELDGLHRRIDDLARALHVGSAADTEQSPSGRDVLDVDTAQMNAFRPLAALKIPGAAAPPAGWSQSSNVSMPGSLVAPPIPGMTPPHEAPSPHEAMTHPPVVGGPAPAQSVATIPPVLNAPPDPLLAPVSVVMPHAVRGAHSAVAAAQSPLAQHAHAAPAAAYGSVPQPAHAPTAVAASAAAASASAHALDRTLPPGGQASVSGSPARAVNTSIGRTPQATPPSSVHRSVPPARTGGGAPLPTFDRKSVLPQPRTRPLELNMTPPAAPPGATAPPAEAATMLEQNISALEQAPAEPPKTTRRQESRAELRTDPRVEVPDLPRFPSSPIGGRSPPPPDPTLPMALEPPLPPPQQRRRDDDEVTQLDPLEPELMARLQAPNPAERHPAPPMTTSSEQRALRHQFEEPALPARVTGGGLVRGRDATTNVLHVEETAWPDVAGAGVSQGWELDNLLGDFAREVEGADPPSSPSRRKA